MILGTEVLCLRELFGCFEVWETRRYLEGLGWDVMYNQNPDHSCSSWWFKLAAGVCAWGVSGCFVSGSGVRIGLVSSMWWFLTRVVRWNNEFMSSANPGGLMTAWKPWVLDAEDERVIVLDTKEWRDLFRPRVAHAIRFRHIASGHRFVFIHMERFGDHDGSVIAEARRQVGTVSSLSGVSELAILPIAISTSSSTCSLDVSALTVDRERTTESGFHSTITLRTN